MPSQDIRLTPTSFAVLGLVAQAGTATPYDLKGAIEVSVENFWNVPHTTFYAEPERLAKAGYLHEEREEGGRRKKLYSMTDRGCEALAAWLASDEVAPPQLRDEVMLKVFFGADPAPLVARRVAHHRAKLAELEGYLEAVRETGRPRGVELTLLAGTAYERAMIELLETFAAG